MALEPEFLPLIKGSKPGQVLLPQGHWQCLETFLGVTTEAVLLEIRR